VLVAGNSPGSADFAARHRFSIGLAFLPPQAAAYDALARVGAAVRDGGHPRARELTPGAAR
jgi:alkanesulfonate monooxygenase SsuD/methylene tetrahydromethanopterin reductase-like flavin-dependent oxidoreductase (luciferase family)